MKKIFLFCLALGAFHFGAEGQISLNGSYSANFNSYNPSSSTNLASTIGSGWAASSSGTAAYNGQGSGTSSTGGYWAYGSGSDYSLGALRSGGAGNITYSVSFTNGSAFTMTWLTISWVYEQYRYANASGWDVSGTGALAGNTTLNAKDFSGVSSGTAGTVSTTAISSFTLTGLNIAPGASFGISWVTTDLTSSDNGVAIDDFNIAAIPEPHEYAVAMGALLGILIFIRRRQFTSH